jgi:hypothetical protein
METQFYIVFNMRTPEGWESFAKFFIGNKREEAKNLFAMLKGTDTIQETYPLTIDFMETVDELPVNLNMINCTLAQIAENTKIITKELFRLHLL